MTTWNSKNQALVTAIIVTAALNGWAQTREKSAVPDGWTQLQASGAAGTSSTSADAQPAASNAQPVVSAETTTGSTESTTSAEAADSPVAPVQAMPASTEDTAAPTPKAATPEQPKPEEKKKPIKLQLASEDGNFSLSPLLLVQPTFVIPVDPEADVPAAGSGVVLKRARLGFEATLFKIASVKLWGDFRNGTPELVDGYVDVDPLKGKLVIRFGWFRPWFGRQRLTSASKLEFVEFAQAWNDKQLGLNLNRDMGVALNGMAGNVFEWGLGIFNGEKSFALTSNRDFGLAARFAVHPLAAAGLSDPLKPNDETALKAPDKPALSIGSALSFESRRDREVTIDEAEDPVPYEDAQLKVGAELGFQWSRLAIQSEVFWMKTLLSDDTTSDVVTYIDGQTPTAAVRGTGLGTYFQAGVMVVKNIFELGGRFDWVDEHLDTDGSRFYPSFAANIYIKGHSLKLQTFYRADIAAGYEESHSNWSDKPAHLIEVMLQAGF